MGDQIDLPFAAELAPAEAIKYFEDKGYEITFNWQEMEEEAHATAFTVAKSMSFDILVTIRESLDEALAQGQTVQAFIKNLEPKLKKLGWWGKKTVTNPKTGQQEQVQLGSAWRLEVIYRTNLQSAYMHGRYQEQVENTDIQPYWQYVAVLDEKTRPSHSAMHEKIFAHDDPIWDMLYPPNGFNCRCRVSPLSERRFKKTGKTLSNGKEENFQPDKGFSFSPSQYLDVIAKKLLDSLANFSPAVQNKIIQDAIAKHPKLEPIFEKLGAI